MRSPFTGKFFQTVSLSQQVRGHRLNAFSEMSMANIYAAAHIGAVLVLNAINLDRAAHGTDAAVKPLSKT